jgi:hypothetical protein
MSFVGSIGFASRKGSFGTKIGTIPAIFRVSKAVAAIRANFEDEGDLRAAIEARGSFPGVSDRREAWAVERIVAGWQLQPLPCPR